MKCVKCNKDFYGSGKLLNIDGDFACSIECENKYIKERDIFFKSIIHCPIIPEGMIDINK